MRTSLRQRTPGGLWLPGGAVGAAQSKVLAQLDARSDALLGLVPGVAGMVQPFPATAAALIAALGSPGGWVDGDIAAIYKCEDAGNLTDSLGLGPNLVAGNSPLNSRTGVGLLGTSFASKTVVELLQGTATNRYADAGHTFGDPGSGILSALIVARINSSTDISGGRYPRVVSKQLGWVSGALWAFELETATAYPILLLGTSTYAGAIVARISVDVRDNAWHSYAIILNGTNSKGSLLSDVGDGANLGAYTGTLSSTQTRLAIGDVNFGANTRAVHMQVAYLAFATNEITGAMRAAFWKHAQAAAISGTAASYARTNPLRAPISASQVAITGAGQLPVGYHPSMSTGDGDGFGVGAIFEDGGSFLGLNSAAVTSWIAGNVTITAVDGPSGMRSATRVADTSGALAGYMESAAATISGNTHTAHAFGCLVQQGGVGASGSVRAYFAGDGGGAQEITAFSFAGNVPASWTTWAGTGPAPTYWGTVTPTGTGHVTVVLRCFPTDGVAASQGTVDFAEFWGRVGSTPPLAWRLTTAGAALQISTPGLSFANTGNARYTPARGRARLRLAGFAGTNGAVFMSCGAAAAKGALVLDYSGGQLRLRVWDNTPALVATVNCGALSSAEHVLDVRWNAGGSLSVIDNGVVIGSATPGAWMPSAVDVTPIYVGADSAGANAARCWIARVQFFTF